MPEIALSLHEPHADPIRLGSEPRLGRRFA